MSFVVVNQTARLITTPLPQSTQSQILNRICTISSASTSSRTRPGMHFLKADASHHYYYDPYKGLVTLSDHPRGLEVGPPIHNPWRLRLKFFAAPVNLLLQTDARDAHNTLHRQPLDGSSWRLGMDIVIGSWKKAHLKRNRSGGSKYDPIVSFIGGLRRYAGGSPHTDLSSSSRDRFIARECLMISWIN